MADDKIGLELEVKLQAAESIDELKSLIEEIKSKMLEVGESSEQFNKLAETAAKAKDKINDLNYAIEKVDPDKRFQGVLRIGQSMTAGFTTATAAAGLFGSASEDVQRSLLKVQSAQAALQGLQVIFSQPVSPAQILTLAITGIYAAMDYWSKSVERANAELDKQIAANDKLIASIHDTTDARNKAIGLEIEYKKAIGASADEIHRLTVEQEQNAILENQRTVALLKKNLDLAKQELGALTAKQFAGSSVPGGQVVGWLFGPSDSAVSTAADKVEKIQATLDAAETEINASGQRIKIADANFANDKKAQNTKEATDYTAHIEKLRQLSFDNQQFIIDNELTGRSKALAQLQLDQAKELETLKNAYSEKERASEEYHERLNQIDVKYEKLTESINKEIDLQAAARYDDIKEKAEKLKLISLSSAQEVVAAVKQTADVEKKIEQDKWENRIAIAQSAGQTLMALGQIVTNDAKKQEAFNKAAAAIQIVIDSATGVSKAIAAGAGLPFPANLGAIATGVAAVLTGIANAKKLLSKAGQSVPDAPTSIGSTSLPSTSGFTPPDLNAGSQRTSFDDAERRRASGQKNEITVNAIVPATVMTGKQNENEVIYQRSVRRVR